MAERLPGRWRGWHRARAGALVLVAAAVVFADARRVDAADYTWTGAASTAWTTAANWSPPDDYPRAGTDRAIFAGAAARECILTDVIEVGEVRLEASFTRVLTLSDAARLTTATLHVAAGTTVVLGPHTSLTTTAHTLAGTVRLESSAELAFEGGADIAGTLDASAPGSRVTCRGDWRCVGTFITSGDPATSLAIVQPAGGTVDHGANPADTVIVENANKSATTWLSTNAIAQLTIAAGTILTIDAGAILSVSGAIGNAGRIVETAPGHIRHAADALDATSATLGPIAQIAAGAGFRVRLRDADEALNAAAADSAAGVTLLNLRNGDTLVRSATETAASSGVFATAMIGTEAVPGASADTVLQAIPGDVISILYRDNEDATDVREAFLSIAPDTAPTTGIFAR